MNNVELKFPNDLHDFDQSITRRNKAGEQKYVCQKCGIVGWLKKDSDTILIKKGNQAAIEHCSEAGAGHKTQTTMTNPHIGKTIRVLKDVKLSGDVIIPKRSEHIAVECPDSHKKENNMAIWVVFNGEYVRFFDSEREILDKIPIKKEEEEEVLVEIEEVGDESKPEPASEIVDAEFEEIADKSDKQVDEHIEVMDKETIEEVAKKTDDLKAEVQDVIIPISKEMESTLTKTGVVSVGEDEFKIGKYYLEDQDKIDYGSDMAAANHEIEKLTEELTGYKKKYKDLIDAQKKIVEKKGTAIINSFEEKDILCEKFFDYDKGKVLWRSKQNGNVVKIEDMKPSDYQMDFTFKKEETEEEKENE